MLVLNLMSSTVLLQACIYYHSIHIRNCSEDIVQYWNHMIKLEMTPVKHVLNGSRTLVVLSSIGFLCLFAFDMMSANNNSTSSIIFVCTIIPIILCFHYGIRLYLIYNKQLPIITLDTDQKNILGSIEPQRLRQESEDGIILSTISTIAKHDNEKVESDNPIHMGFPG